MIFRKPFYCLFYFTVIFMSIYMTSCVSTRTVRQEKTNMVISRARSYAGTPYKYGGTTVLGMDCSGLLMRSFEVIDVYIPRTSAEQSKLGRKVTMDELKPGDLVFFKTLKKQGRVTHAGIVTDTRKSGQIMFIHSSSSKGVIEVNLLSDYYRSTFVKARRLKF
ncbi:MAG: C40 family peptidase [Cyclobacteriaceae bacterium]|nr:C40 family peptidase [Cyclobacteriaceae bacterium]